MIKFTKTHEWIKLIEKEIVVIGVSDYAQKELSDIVHVELPEIGKEFEQNDVLLTIESVKAASDIYAPIAGQVIEVNQLLSESPEKVNDSPEDEGWLVKLKVKDKSQLNNLIDQDSYLKNLES